MNINQGKALRILARLYSNELNNYKADEATKSKLLADYMVLLKSVPLRQIQTLLDSYKLGVEISE